MRAYGVAVLVFASMLTAPAAGRPAQSPCRPQPRSACPVPLATAQCVEASKIVSSDATVRTLRAHVRSSRVERPDPWGSGDGVHNIGAVVKIQLATPLNVARVVLPTANFAQGDDSGKYTQGHLPASIHGATSLSVFVDLHLHQVVWIIPFPSGSEGPPPTSIPAFTLPKGFTAGTGGASAADADNGLALHLVTFDGTGRLEQEEWADPVSGNAVTKFYYDGKATVSFVSAYDGHTLSVTTIAYGPRTWTSGKGTMPRQAAGVSFLDSHTWPSLMKAMTPDGQEQVLGLDALRVSGKAGIFYFGFSFAEGNGELWVDPATHLPIQQTIDNPVKHTLASKTVFSWVPRTDATAAATTLGVPKGYKHTASTGLPHIFGD